MDIVLAIRILVMVLCSVSLIIMTFGFFRHRHQWNQKTRDYWYGRSMWAAAGFSSALEGIIRNTPFRYATMFILVATIVTLKGNLQKGPWGNQDE